MWEKLKRTDLDSLYKTACFHTVIASVIRAADKSVSAAERRTGRTLEWGWRASLRRLIHSPRQRI